MERLGGIGALEREKLVAEKAYTGEVGGQLNNQMQAGTGQDRQVEVNSKRMRSRDVLLHRIRNEQETYLRKLTSLQAVKEKVEMASDRELDTVLAVLECAL